MPKISVIIPAYNAERTIEETVKTVQAQSFPHWELIIINDGSKDGTLEKVQNIKDKRIKIFSYENGGLPVARNRGIARANGEFITFLDADDLWTSDKLELQLAALEDHPAAGVAYSWTTCMWETEKSLLFEECDPILFAGNVYSQLLISNFIGSGSNVLVRREAIESAGVFEPTLRSCEDWDFYLRMAAIWHFVVIPKHQIIYRKTSGSMTSKAHVMEEQGLLVLEKAYLAAPPALQYLKKQSFASLYRYSADLYFTHGIDASTFRLAQNKLWQAIQLSPKILLDKYTLRLLIKLVLKAILPARIFANVAQFRKSLFANSHDPRVKV